MDHWCSTFIEVEKVEKLIMFQEEGDKDPDTPKSHKSYRSSTSYRSNFNRNRIASHSTKNKLEFLQNHTSNPVPLKIEKPEEDQIVKRLRNRKEKQIQHQKWEEAEQKRIKEEEKLDKIKKYASLSLQYFICQFLQSHSKIVISTKNCVSHFKLLFHFLIEIILKVIRKFTFRLRYRYFTL